MRKEDDKKESKIWWLVGGVVVTTVGFIVIPPLYRKLTNKVAKMSSSTKDIDFNNLGPEIVKNDKHEGEQ